MKKKEHINLFLEKILKIWWIYFLKKWGKYKNSFRLGTEVPTWNIRVFLSLRLKSSISRNIINFFRVIKIRLFIEIVFYNTFTKLLQFLVMAFFFFFFERSKISPLKCKKFFNHCHFPKYKKTFFFRKYKNVFRAVFLGDIWYQEIRRNYAI